MTDSKIEELSKFADMARAEATAWVKYCDNSKDKSRGDYNVPWAESESKAEAMDTVSAKARAEVATWAEADARAEADVEAMNKAAAKAAVWARIVAKALIESKVVAKAADKTAIEARAEAKVKLEAGSCNYCEYYTAKYNFAWCIHPEFDQKIISADGLQYPCREGHLTRIPFARPDLCPLT